MTEADLHASDSLGARLDALARVTAMLDWPLPRERDEQVCCEIVVAIDRLLAMVARGAGALDLAIGDALAQLATGDGVLVLGHSGIPDYSREELDIAGSTAQKLMRLSRELGSRPLLRAAVWEGTVTCRQAEAVLPVARGDDEALWVERARNGTVRALEKAASRLGAADPDEEENRTVFRADVPPEQRAVVDEAEELAAAVLGATSPRCERARAVWQEYLSTHPIGDDSGASFSAGGDASLEPLKEWLEQETEQWASLGCPAPVPAPEALPDGANVCALHQELRRLALQRPAMG